MPDDVPDADRAVEPVSASVIDQHRFADIVFSPAAVADLSGSDAERLAAITAAYFEPATTSPMRGAGRQTWRVRDRIALIVDDRNEVVRVVEREPGQPDEQPAPPTLALSPPPGGRRVRGHRGGTNVPTTAAELLELACAAHLRVEETDKGNHWRISRPGFRGPRVTSGMVFVSSTSNPAELGENVAKIRRECGIDLRKLKSHRQRGVTGRRRGLADATTNPPKLIIEDGPTRRESAARTWTKPAGDVDPDPMSATATATAAPGAVEDAPAPTPPSEDTVTALLGPAQLAASGGGSLTAYDRLGAVSRYVSAARAAGTKDFAIAGLLGMSANALAARMSKARRVGHPDAPPAAKSYTDPGSGRVTLAGQTARVTDEPRRVNGAAPPRPASPPAPAPPVRRRKAGETTEEQAQRVEQWLAEHAEPEGEDAAADDELDELMLDPTDPTVDPEHVDPEPELPRRELLPETDTADTDTVPALADEHPAQERPASVADELALMRQLLTELRLSRTEPEPTSPADVLVDALREVGAEVSTSQLRMARMALADRGWEITITGRA